MIFLVVDGRIVAIGPDWMEHHFIEDGAEHFPDETVRVVKEGKS